MTDKYDNVIIIPYRNRKKHLDYFIENTVPLIEKVMPNTLVVVIEQEDGKLFNRGSLLNIGFKIYENKTKYFITHDIDLNPTKLFVESKYNCEIDKNNIQGLFTSVYGTLGGIVKIRSDDIFDINGFPNNFWGWGAEDKALQVRADFFKKNISKFLLNDKKDKGMYLKRFDDINDRQKQNNTKNYHIYNNNFPTLSHDKKFELIMSSGLNNIVFKTIEHKKLHNIVELIKVSI